MIHYYSGRHSTESVAVAILQRHHGLISFADPRQVAIAAEVCQSFALDNGAFSMWKSGVNVDWEKYYEWVDIWRQHPGFDWAIIPDVIDGNEAANDALIEAWPLGTIGVPVWHLHEPVNRLRRLAEEWPRVALGSSGEFAVPGTNLWWLCIEAAMDEICPDGKPITKLHGLRMLSPKIVPYLPLSSADSSNVSRRVNMTKWEGPYKTASRETKARLLVDYYEGVQSSPFWGGTPDSLEIAAA